MVHATAKYYTDPWAYPWVFRGPWSPRPESWRHRVLQAVVVGLNLVFMVGLVVGHGLVVWAWWRIQRWFGWKEIRMSSSMRMAKRPRMRRLLNLIDRKSLMRIRRDSSLKEAKAMSVKCIW